MLSHGKLCSASQRQPAMVDHTGDATTPPFITYNDKAWYFQHIGEENVKRNSEAKNES